MSVPAEVAGDIHLKVPGAADSLQHLSMQYILRLERVPGGCHPHLEGLAPYPIWPPMSAVCQGPYVVCHCRFFSRFR